MKISVWSFVIAFVVVLLFLSHPSCSSAIKKPIEIETDDGTDKIGGDCFITISKAKVFPRVPEKPKEPKEKSKTSDTEFLPSARPLDFARQRKSVCL